MNNKQIIALVSALALLSITPSVSADFDCGTLDREEMREVYDKKRNGETLSSSEEKLLENAKNCKSGKKGPRGFNLSDEQKEKIEDMRVILEKNKNGETLTEEEQEMFEKYEENKGKIVKVMKKRRIVRNLPQKTSNAINSVLTKYQNANSNLTNEEKIEKYENLQEKLENKLSSIQDSSKLSDAKKESYEDVINELLNRLDDMILEVENS